MNEVIGYASRATSIGLVYLQNTTVLLVIMAVGLVLGVCGLKLAKVWSACVGLVIGAAIGSGIMLVAGLTGVTAIGAILGCAAVLAVLFAIFHRIGMFLYLIGIGVSLASFATGFGSVVGIAAGAAIGLIFALLSLKWFDPFVIFATSANGAVPAGFAAAMLLSLNGNTMVTAALCAVLWLVFVAVQFIMRSRQVGREQTKRAKEQRKKVSRENDVEEARRILNLDDPDDDYEDDEDYYEDDEDDYEDDEDDYDGYDEEGYDDEYDDEYDDDFEYIEDDDDSDDDGYLEDDDDFTIIQ